MTRRLLVLAGAGVLLYAALGLLTDPGVQLLGVLLFLAAVLVGHDAVWMPLMLAAISVVGRGRKNVVGRRRKNVVGQGRKDVAGGRRKDSERTAARDDGAPDE
jgi:hypothetical protein